jgi:DNA-binding LytR/AlgR family response regulator/tetratricopeptide (TPR) repeat protein
MMSFRSLHLFLLFAAIGLQLSAQSGINKLSEAIGDKDIPQYSSKQDSLSQQIKNYEALLKDLESNSTGSETVAPILSKLGQMYMNTQDYPKAIEKYVQSLMTKSKGKITNADLGWHLIEIGNSLYRIKDYAAAVYPYSMAVQTFSKASGAEGAEGLITAKNNIGLCKLSLGKPAEALTVFSENLEMSEKLGESQRIYVSRIYVSMCHAELKNFEKGIGILTDPEMTIMVDSLDPLNLFRLQQLALIYSKSNQDKNAIAIFKRICAMPVNENLADYIIDAHLSLSVYYFNHNDVDQALSHGMSAEKILASFFNRSDQMRADKNMYLIYKKKGNYREALKYFESYVANQEIENSLEVERYITEYNKNAERIANGIEIDRIEAQKNQAEAEKRNQRNLSYFMIIITTLLLIMLFTGNGFEPRVQLLEEYVSEMKLPNKIISIAIMLQYFIFFFYFFIPVEYGLHIVQQSFLDKILPGFIAFVVLSLVVFVFYYVQAKRSSENKYYRSYIILFAASYLSALVAEFLHFYFTKESISLNFSLSLSLITLAAFVVPLYLILLLVERLFVKKFETLSASLTQDISQIKQSITPTEETITVSSEKTSGKIVFNINDLVAIEAQGNYCMFYINKKQVVTRKLLHTTMKALETQLSDYPQIIRCHKSFLINIHQIVRVSGNSRGYVLHFSGDIEPIPVSRGYQKDVMGIVRHFREEIS